MKNKAYLSLGSNLGDRVAHLKQAVECLESHPHIEVMGKSSFYTTAPVGYLEQEDFINIAVAIETSLAPKALLIVCQDIEQQLKRVRLIHWGPRTIDVDLLWFEDYQNESEQLTVPHPRMHERGFVMIPLCELNSSLVIGGKTVLEWCDELIGQEVRKMTDETW